MADDSEPEEPFAEYGEVDEPYREPEEGEIGPSIPEAPDLSDRAVDPVVAGTFWTLVVVFNVGLVAVSVGVMFVLFQGNLRLGGQLLLGGAIVLAYGVYKYRRGKELVAQRVDDGDGENGADGIGSDHDSVDDDHNG